MIQQDYLAEWMKQMGLTPPEPTPLPTMIPPKEEEKTTDYLGEWSKQLFGEAPPQQVPMAPPVRPTEPTMSAAPIQGGGVPADILKQIPLMRGSGIPMGSMSQRTAEQTGADMAAMPQNLLKNIQQFAQGTMEQMAVPPAQPGQMAEYLQHPKTGLKEMGEGAAGMVKYPLDVLNGLRENPKKFITERPLDVIGLIAVGAGVAGKGLINRARAGATIPKAEVVKAAQAVKDIPPQLVDEILANLPDEIPVKGTKWPSQEITPAKIAEQKALRGEARQGVVSDHATRMKAIEAEPPVQTIGQKPVKGETYVTPTGKQYNISPADVDIFDLKETGISGEGGARILTDDALNTYHVFPDREGAWKINSVKEAKTAPEGTLPDTIIKKHSGYPFAEEFKKSLANIGLIAKQPEKPGIPIEKPPTPKVITAKTPAVKLSEYTIPSKDPLLALPSKRKGLMKTFEHEIRPYLDRQAKDISLGKIKIAIENPIRVFEDTPNLKELFVYPEREARFKVAVAKDTVGKQIGDWKMSLRKEGATVGHSSEKIAAHLTANEQGIEILQAMGKDYLLKEKLTPAEQSIVDTVRKQYDTYFTEVNKARTLAGLKPMKHVNEYFTLMRNTNILEDMGMTLGTAETPVIDTHLAGNVFKYAIKRKMYKGKPVDVPISLDFFEVFRRYAHKAEETINYTPLVAKSRSMLQEFILPTSELTKAGKTKYTRWSMWDDYPRTATYLQEWTDFIAGQRKGSTNPYVRTFERYAQKLNRNISMAILSANARTALIQPTSLRLSWIETGTNSLADGIIKNLQPEWRDFAMKNSKVLYGRKTSDVMLQDLFEKKWSKTQRTVGKSIGKAGLAPMQFLDMEAARSTWLGAYHKAKNTLKFVDKDAFRYADDVVIKTQASGAAADISPLQRSPMGRFMTTFNTFVINEWNQISKDILGIRNPKIAGTTKHAVQVARLVFATAVCNALFEGVLKLRSPYPAPEWAVIHGIKDADNWQDIAGASTREMAEQVPIIGGTIRWSTPWRTPLPAGAQTLTDTGTLIAKITRDFDFSNVKKDDLETLGKLLGIPGTSQVMKYIRRRKKGIPHVQALIGIRTETAEPKAPTRTW